MAVNGSYSTVVALTIAASSSSSSDGGGGVLSSTVVYCCYTLLLVDCSLYCIFLHSNGVVAFLFSMHHPQIQDSLHLVTVHFCTIMRVKR